MPRNPWLPWKTLGVQPISELGFYLLLNCNQRVAAKFSAAKEGRVSRVKKG